MYIILRKYFLRGSQKEADITESGERHFIRKKQDEAGVHRDFLYSLLNC